MAGPVPSNYCASSGSGMVSQRSQASKLSIFLQKFGIFLVYPQTSFDRRYLYRKNIDTKKGCDTSFLDIRNSESQKSTFLNF